MAADIQHAHQLLDQLGPSQLAAVVHLLETMVSPEEHTDTLSDAERKVVAEADGWLTHNQPIPHEEVLLEFGLTRADWDKMEEPLARSLALAPVEEQEIAPETAAALDRARASLARVEGITHGEILREFGLGQSKDAAQTGLRSA
jgi:hypothetical protein